MMSVRVTATVIALALALCGNAWACTVPKPGYNMDGDELISEAKTIVLVRLGSRVPTKEQNLWTKYTLETVEVIKGKATPTYEFFSMGSKESDQDFAGHTEKQFWEQSVGRSEWPCCICGPDHAFREGRLYVYFPDKLGAVKSAEVIHGNGDRWLEYVRSRAKMAANPALQGTR